MLDETPGNPSDEGKDRPGAGLTEQFAQLLQRPAANATVSLHGTSGAAAKGLAEAGFAARPLPVQHSTFWQARQLCLWLIATAEDRLDGVLCGLGISAESYALLAEHCGQELADMALLHRTGKALDRRGLAALLRNRVNGMSMAAQSPAELAAVARTVRSMPDWVWVEADAQSAEAQSVQAESCPLGEGRAATGYNPVWASQLPDTLRDSLLVPLPNRAERRRREAQQRKTK